jgi:hypothetical protein
MNLFDNDRVVLTRENVFLASDPYQPTPLYTIVDKVNCTMSVATRDEADVLDNLVHHWQENTPTEDEVTAVLLAATNAFPTYTLCVH